MTLACVYGPNWDDEAFITKLFSSLPNLENYYLIIGGDLNLIQDVLLDRSSSKAFYLSKSSKTLEFFKAQLGIVDPWRHGNPTVKNLSHKIKEVDNRYTLNLNLSLYTERVKLQSSLNLTTTTAVMVQVIKTKQSLFE